ncbi:MAG TPA: YihY/virulence factor BrkB family protein [Anaerolineales bacterium]|nr:YihY/virulence factor BrkB family protein [Anaerolineales bacterium]
MATVKFILRLFHEAYNEWSHDRAARVGAALAYYALFSLAPLLVIMITIAGAVYGEAAAKGQIVDAISGQIGPDAAVGVERLLADVHDAGSRLFSTIVSSVILIIGATNLFSQLRDALNTMWNVRPKPRNHFLGGVLEIVRDRFLATLMVISLGIVLLAALAMGTGLTVLNGWLKTLITPETSFLLEAGNLLTGFGLITLLFALTFKLLPDVKISWRVVWVGALVTSFLFNVGAFLIGLYLGYGNARTILGAAGSLVVLMIWIAYSAQIIFFGAKFALVYASAIGRPIVPASNAVSVKLSVADDSLDG